MDKWKRATVILSAVCLVLLVSVLWFAIGNSQSAGAAGSIATVGISDIRFKAMVIQYVQLDDKGTMGYTARLDYDVLDMNGEQIQSVSKDVTLAGSDISWISSFVNTKTALAKTSATIMKSDKIK